MSVRTLGIGVDVVDLPSFAALLADPASHFRAATFTPDERAYAVRAVSGEPVQHLAARYAAKEAALKALDQASARAGISPGAVPLLDIEVRRDAAGRPWLALHGHAAALAARLGVTEALVTLSHEGATAVAVVLIEGATPAPPPPAG